MALKAKNYVGNRVSNAKFVNFSTVFHKKYQCPSLFFKILLSKTLATDFQDDSLKIQTKGDKSFKCSFCFFFQQQMPKDLLVSSSST